ncbi:uncharacterized protein CDAR_28821 [Caerostris darwini]|uniref:Sushi domain-containing protein n=1 Tax=Caerostris darwini TaxID=1538125 RepID=A0AAV4Q2B7_9ARAC|nr:uncharacterized protein CDAR_28821 [Caerostris darwini]
MKQRKQITISTSVALTISIILHATPILDALCHPSSLPKGVSVVGSCHYQSNDVCNVQCVLLGTVIWKDNTKCLPQGKWTALPFCRTTHVLELIRCNKLTDFTEKNLSSCVKIKITTPGLSSTPKAICPEILRLFVKYSNCNKEPETDCAVSCRNNNYVLLCAVNSQWSPECSSPVQMLCPDIKFAELVNCSRIIGARCKVQCPNGKINAEETICLPTYEWSPLPSCNFRSQCSKQKLTPRIGFVNDTCKNSNVLHCKVGCIMRVSNSNTPKLIFVKYITCKPLGEWQGLPDCSLAEKLFLANLKFQQRCVEPTLDENSFLQGKCSRNEGSVCRFKCREGFVPKGNHTIRCVKKQWIGGHKCEPVSCPHLPDILQFNGTCSRKVGLSCEVRCKSDEPPGTTTVIFCLIFGNWSSLPKCLPSCPRAISKYIKFVNNCSFGDGAKCQVRCQEKFALVGWHFIKCRAGIWRNLPRCFPENISPYNQLKMQCSFPPPLHGNLKIIGDCKPKGVLAATSVVEMNLQSWLVQTLLPACHLVFGAL